MVQTQIKIQSPTGLHARPATVFVNRAKSFASKIAVSHGGKEADAKSILSVMALGVKDEAVVDLKAEGPDEAAAIEALVKLVQSNFKED